MVNGCGLQMDGFSAHFDEYEFIFNDFHDFDDCAVISDGLTLFPEGSGTSESALKVPGPFGSVLWWSDAASRRSQDPPSVSWRSRDPLRVSCPTGRNYSGQVATCPDLSRLVGTPVALRDLPWGPIYI